MLKVHRLFITVVPLLMIMILISACDNETGVKKGDLAPDIQETALDGKNIKLSDYKGKIVVINFWGMWCGYCVQEMPEFNKAEREYPNVVFLMVNTSNQLKYEDISEIKNFLKSNNLAFENILLNTKAAQTYQVRSFPTTFIIDKNGKIADSVIGAVNYDILKNMVEKAGK